MSGSKRNQRQYDSSKHHSENDYPISRAIKAKQVVKRRGQGEKTACDFVCKDSVVQCTDLHEFMKTRLANIL